MNTVSCALKCMDGDAFLLMDVEKQKCIWYSSVKFSMLQKDTVQLSVQYIIWHSNQVLGQ